MKAASPARDNGKEAVLHSFQSTQKAKERKVTLAVLFQSGGRINTLTHHQGVYPIIRQITGAPNSNSTKRY